LTRGTRRAAKPLALIRPRAFVPPARSDDALLESASGGGTAGGSPSRTARLNARAHVGTPNIVRPRFLKTRVAPGSHGRGGVLFWHKKRGSQQTRGRPSASSRLGTTMAVENRGLLMAGRAMDPPSSTTARPPGGTIPRWRGRPAGQVGAGHFRKKPPGSAKATRSRARVRQTWPSVRAGTAGPSSRERSPIAQIRCGRRLYGGAFYAIGRQAKAVGLPDGRGPRATCRELGGGSANTWRSKRRFDGAAHTIAPTARGRGMAAASKGTTYFYRQPPERPRQGICAQT